MNAGIPATWIEYQTNWFKAEGDMLASVGCVSFASGLGLNRPLAVVLREACLEPRPTLPFFALAVGSVVTGLLALVSVKILQMARPDSSSAKLMGLYLGCVACRLLAMAWTLASLLAVSACAWNPYDFLLVAVLFGHSLWVQVQSVWRLLPRTGSMSQPESQPEGSREPTRVAGGGGR